MIPTTSFGQPQVHNNVYGGSIQGSPANGLYYLGHNYPNPTPPHIKPTSPSPLTFNTTIESHSSRPSIPLAPTHPNLLRHYSGITSSTIGNSINALTEPSISLTTSTVVSDNAWYPDSEATNHLTSNASQLDHSISYKVSGKILLENGFLVPIMKVGQSSFLSNPRRLHLLG